MKSASGERSGTKDFPWRPRTLFAPMEGVTSPPVREIMAARGGVGVVCTEFVRITSTPLGRRMLRKHMGKPSRGALSVQVMGNHLEHMAEATEMVTDAGADIVDINLGCPAPKAVRKGVGSAMLKDLPLLGRVLSAMRQRTHLPLSAKIRAGYDDASRVLEVARVVQESGADFITVHPRRRVDFYQGVADWRIISTLSRELRIPVVGNGDVWYAADALRMRRETGCDAVMIGRPALRNPWIFQQIEALETGATPVAPDGEMVLHYVEQLIEMLAEAYPTRPADGWLKEQMGYVSRGMPDRAGFWRDIRRIPTADGIRRLVAERVAPLKASQLDFSAAGGLQEKSGSAVLPQELPPSPSPLACDAS